MPDTLPAPFLYRLKNFNNGYPICPETRKLLIHGVCYIGGLSVTNSLLGVTAALTGGLMGAMLQSPLVLGAVAAILVFFATSLLGFWELRLPYWLTQAASKSYSGYFGSLFMGIRLGNLPFANFHKSCANLKKIGLPNLLTG